MVRKEQVPKLGRSVPEVHCVAAQCQAAEIPQKCPGMGKTGHEAERGWFRAVWSGNIARSRCDKKMPRPISKVVLHKRGRPGCQGEGQITFPAQECGAELAAGCSGRASVRSERQVGDGVEFGPLLSVK